MVSGAVLRATVPFNTQHNHAYLSTPSPLGEELVLARLHLMIYHITRVSEAVINFLFWLGFESPCCNYKQHYFFFKFNYRTNHNKSTRNTTDRFFKR